MCVGVFVFAACGADGAQSAQPPVHDVTALAKETQKPVGNVVSVPFQFNFNTGGLGVTRSTVLSGRRMTLGAQYYTNLEHPAGAAGHQLRLVVTLIFPTAKP